VLVLLALASSPALAGAESAPPDYVSEVPNESHKETPKQHKSIGGGGTESGKSSGGNPVAHTSTDSPEGGESEDSSKGSSSGGGTPGSTGDGGNNAGTGQGSPGSGSSSKASPSVGDGKPLVTSNSSNNGSSSSSPLVPILIAIAALAAISIGAFVIRQRRRGDDSGRFSPEAS
jgi:cobalamin biosynthesis Mg chelatase CobN